MIICNNSHRKLIYMLLLKIQVVKFINLLLHLEFESFSDNHSFHLGYKNIHMYFFSDICMVSLLHLDSYCIWCIVWGMNVIFFMVKWPTSCPNVVYFKSSFLDPVIWGAVFIIHVFLCELGSVSGLRSCSVYPHTTTTLLGSLTLRAVKNPYIVVPPHPRGPPHLWIQRTLDHLLL